MKKTLIITLCGVLIYGCTILCLEQYSDKDTKNKNKAKSVAAAIVANINNYCATAEMNKVLDNTFENICDDGITKSEALSIAKSWNKEMSDIIDFDVVQIDNLYYDTTLKKLTKLSIISNGHKVNYNGSEYSVD